MLFNPEQKQFFEENGYVVVPDILSPVQLEELRLMIDKVMEGQLTPETGGVTGDFHLQFEPALEHDPAVRRRDKIRVIFHMCHSHPFFWNHATRPEIVDVVESILGPKITLYTDQMFAKPAHHGSLVPFHQDAAYWPNVHPNMLSCWVAIDDATMENGCVRMIPGSHKQAIPHSRYTGTQSYGIPEEEVDISREVPVEIKAGGAMFHHSLTIHRSFPNRSDKARRGLVTIYMPSDLTFVKPWDFRYGFKQIR
ncbi:MAG: phytanoyl-CoA dioxygenase family protein [Paenibacillaceae bacterium]|nr:phytanoyl-CoA dioxygenase family protein [Paenibacillaceae bacterium]